MEKWKIGIMEKWGKIMEGLKNGIMEKWELPNIPLFQYSTIPIFHYSYFHRAVILRY
ncbi:MAG: hypothetical protein QHH13_11860 [Melioribacter sp.]|nr:hypothetical protein [Melioribacter sp.]